MKPIQSPLLLALALVFAPFACAETSSPSTEARPAVDLSAPGAEQLAAPSHPGQVTVTRAATGSGLDIAIAPGPAGYPGVNFSPSGGGQYDFTGSGYIEARVTNTCAHVLYVTLRVDGDGTTRICSGNAYLKPGATGTARAYFASPYESSNPVDPAHVARLMVFTAKNTTLDRSFRIESITLGGAPGDKAPVNPDIVRHKPDGGVLYKAGQPFVAGRQLVPRGGAKAAVADHGVAVTLAGKPDQSVLLRPASGLWDLGDFLQVTVRVKNTGAAPAAPVVQLTSRGGVSDFGRADKPLAPGATADLVIPFRPREPFQILSSPEQEQLEVKKSWGLKEAPGARFTSHQTSGVLITADAGSPDSTFEIVSVVASMPRPAAVPAWLGSRPPVDGEWVKTFEDNFDGTKLDTAVWNTHAENYWDKRVGFSTQNVIVGDGVARLRIEKRAGHHNDDPNGRATEFATGWLDTYGKWTQRYGYFEVRVKLPTAPSMFPAFWLMPERGPANWPKYRRTDTKDGGMEFDVFEGQSAWGPYRTTFGMHWDAYGKYHKSAGMGTHYNLPDKDGFLTIGMLWTPGHVAVYSNGHLDGTWDSPRVGTVESYLIFDMLPGGFEYDPLDPAKLPADLVVDYVRVWQRKDLASPDDGPKSLK